MSLAFWFVASVSAHKNDGKAVLVATISLTLISEAFFVGLYLLVKSLI